MALPAFNEEGDLPPACTAQPFGGSGTLRPGRTQRRVMAGRLDRLYTLATTTGHLARFVIFGSFVTAKAEPNDVDVILLMEDSFDLAKVTGEAALLFQHMEADAHFGASVFWTRKAGALEGSKR